MDKNKASELFRKAVEDGRNRNYSAAVKKLKHVLSITDNHSSALLYLGRAYHELKKFDDAVIAFRLYITKSPKSGAGYFYLGRTYIALGKFRRAVSCFSETVGLNPEFAPANAYMGYALMRTGRTVRAVEYLRTAVELEPENSRIYMMYINSILVMSMKEFRRENYEASLRGLLFLEEAGFSTITTKLYVGIILKEQGRYSDAITYIEDASEESPEDYNIKDILAELLLQTGDVESAMQHMQTYRSKEETRDFLNTIDSSERVFAVSFWNKKDFDAALYFALASLKRERTSEMHLLAGECQKAAGRLEEAYNHYTRAAEIDKVSVEPYYGRAIIRWMRNEFAEMADELKKITARDSENDFAQYYEILCSWKIGAPWGKWKENLENRLKKEKDSWLLTAKGWGLLSADEVSASVKVFRQALKISESLHDSWYGLIEALSRIGNESQLRITLKKYLKNFEDDTQKRTLYAELLIDSENYKEAAEELRILLSESGSDMNRLKKYAFCCRKAGMFSDASILYRQILSADPYNEKYLKMLLYCMRKDGRDAETIPVLEAAVEAFKEPSVELLLVYGSTLYRNDRDEEALAVFQKCIYNGIKDWRLYRNIGVLYKNKGLNEWAEMYIKKSEKLKKN